MPAKTNLKRDDEAWTACRKELDAVWKDLHDALKKADKVLEAFGDDDTLSPSASRRKAELVEIVQHCEADKHNVEFAIKWRKDGAKADLTLATAQGMQTCAAGHLADLIDAFKAAKAISVSKKPAAQK